MGVSKRPASRLNQEDQEALRELINLADVALVNVRKPLLFMDPNAKVNSGAFPRTGISILESCVDKLGPLCGVRMKEPSSQEPTP